MLHCESPYRPDEPEPEPVQAVQPAAEGGERREPMSPMRQAIAQHMVESRQTAAHCTTIVEVDMSRVAARRAELKEAMARRGVPLTYLAFVAVATVEALERHPVLNASVDGDEIVHHDDVNLGIAVALDEGLIVPVIPQAQRLSLEGMAAAIADVAERARSKRLEPDEVHGGTFTITNPGQFGAVLATPIINQPQVAILDLEAIVKRPVVVEDPAGGDSIAIRPMTYLPMSWDHRALDGAEAARFLSRVKAPARGLGGRVMGARSAAGAQRPGDGGSPGRGRARRGRRPVALRPRGARGAPRASAAAPTCVVAVHSTALGPALGGLRIWHYADDRRRHRATRCGWPPG